MIGVFKGLSVTFGHLVRPSLTIQYPKERRTLPGRSRSSFALLRDPDGNPICKACQLCVRDCPDGAILIESEKPPEGGGRVLTRFEIDLGRCMYCGLCIESCTSDALVSTPEFEHASPERDDLTLLLFERPAQPNGSAAQEGDQRAERDA